MAATNVKHCATCRMLFADHVQQCPQDEMPLSIVRELEPGMIVRGKYRILEWIGAGGMAAVYRARHTMLNEDRALKVVLPKYASDEDFLKRFRREAAVARKLRHENAVWVEDLDELEDGRPFIAMEFLHGCDLRALIRNEAPLPVERARTLALQVASALGAAHDLGIVHRDIKPENIFITRGAKGPEIAKVLDFGIAKAKEGTLEGSVYQSTVAGFIMGTPQYMSPEQAMGLTGNKIDGRSDIYSLGILIYEMLTGRLPFVSATPISMVLDHIHSHPQPPHELMPELHIPEALSLLLMKALEKDPAQRFQAAGELMQALRNPAAWAASAGVVQYVPTKVVAPAVVSPLPSVAPAAPVTEALPQAAPESPEEEKESRRSFQPWMVAVLILAVALAGIGVTVFRHITDARIKDRLESVFQNGPNSGLHGVTVQEVNDGNVILAGSVPNDAQRIAACELADGVSGVVTCVSYITVVKAEATPAVPQR